jgi:hypothetical protein
MRRSEREIKDRRQVEAVLERAAVLYLALADGGEPYVVPMNFGYQDGCLFLHSASEGRKIEALRRNPTVCFATVADQEVVPAATACHWSVKYRSVIGWGRASFVEEPGEKERALDTIMRKFAPGLSSYDRKTLARACVIRISIEKMTGKQAGY